MGITYTMLIDNRVRVKGSEFEGTVVDIWGSEATVNKTETLIGVEFETKIPSGHSCRGMGKDEYCYYFKSWELEKI